MTEIEARFYLFIENYKRMLQKPDQMQVITELKKKLESLKPGHRLVLVDKEYV